MNISYNETAVSGSTAAPTGSIVRACFQTMQNSVVGRTYKNILISDIKARICPLYTMPESKNPGRLFGFGYIALRDENKPFRLKGGLSIYRKLAVFV